jgi:hypothetical protein
MAAMSRLRYPNVAADNSVSFVTLVREAVASNSV